MAVYILIKTTDIIANFNHHGWVINNNIKIKQGPINIISL